MTTTEAPAMPYTITEDLDRISAVDTAGVEICGAYRPQGHDTWCVFVTTRLTDHLHHVIALTPQIARWHVEMLAELFVAGVR